MALDNISSALVDEKYLHPVLEDDPLLYAMDESSDDGDEVGFKGDHVSAEKRAKELEEQLEKLKGEFAEYKEMVGRNFAETLKERMHVDDVPGKGKETTNGEVWKKEREDDSHYFTSYAGIGM